MKWITGAACLLLTLVACGSDVDQTQLEAGGEALDGTQQYDDIAGLVDDLSERGIDCADLELRQSFGIAESADCYLDGKQYILEVFGSPDGRDKQVEARERVQANLDGQSCNVLGRGAGAWAVNASKNVTVCEDIAEALGGQARIVGT
ncbi:hypothetical protein [Modestobacter sp. SYSU DS0875]